VLFLVCELLCQGSNLIKRAGSAVPVYPGITFDKGAGFTGFILFGTCISGTVAVVTIWLDGEEMSQTKDCVNLYFVLPWNNLSLVSVTGLILQTQLVRRQA
jgi:hypothetical protein